MYIIDGREVAYFNKKSIFKCRKAIENKVKLNPNNIGTLGYWNNRHLSRALLGPNPLILLDPS